MKAKVQWPDAAYSGGGDDLSEPLTVLLRDLDLLEPEGLGTAGKHVVEAGLRNTTPFGLQVFGGSRPAPPEPPRYWTRTRGQVRAVQGFTHRDGKIFAVVDGKEVDPRQLDCVTAYSDWDSGR